jgi:hypothetical protein
MTFRALPSEPDLAPTDAPLEPLRLLAGGGSELERRLLHSARLDRVPTAAAARVARELGLDQQIAAGRPPSTHPAASARCARLARFGALAGVGGVAVVAALGLMSARLIGPGPDLGRASTDLPQRATAPLPAPLVPASEAATETASTPAAGPSSNESPRAPEASPAPVSSAASAGSRSRLSRSAARPALARAERAPASGLLAELRALETVQAALRRGRAGEAELSLVASRAAFPSGELAPEAQMLRIDVALARGEHDRALALARAFERRPEATRYRERLRALLESRIEGAARPHWGAEAGTHDPK